MIDIRQFRTFVVQPTLAYLGMGGRAAEQLVLGTAVQESRLTYIDQIDRGEPIWGPAYGLFQMERATHDDIWANWLRWKPLVKRKVGKLLAPVPERHIQLAMNMMYGCAMCRLHYRRVPAPLPPADDARALGRYWKRYYNTVYGAGTVDEFATAYARHVHPLYEGK